MGKTPPCEEVPAAPSRDYFLRVVEANGFLTRVWPASGRERWEGFLQTPLFPEIESTGAAFNRQPCAQF